jgi:hypothetical protein
MLASAQISAQISLLNFLVVLQSERLIRWPYEKLTKVKWAGVNRHHFRFPFRLFCFIAIEIRHFAFELIKSKGAGVLCLKTRLPALSETRNCQLILSERNVEMRQWRGETHNNNSISRPKTQSAAPGWGNHHDKSLLPVFPYSERERERDAGADVNSLPTGRAQVAIFVPWHTVPPAPQRHFVHRKKI